MRKKICLHKSASLSTCYLMMLAEKCKCEFLLFSDNKKLRYKQQSELLTMGMTWWLAGYCPQRGYIYAVTPDHGRA